MLIEEILDKNSNALFRFIRNEENIPVLYYVLDSFNLNVSRICGPSRTFHLQKPVSSIHQVGSHLLLNCIESNESKLFLMDPTSKKLPWEIDFEMNSIATDFCSEQSNGEIAVVCLTRRKFFIGKLNLEYEFPSMGTIDEYALQYDSSSISCRNIESGIDVFIGSKSCIQIFKINFDGEAKEQKPITNESGEIKGLLWISTLVAWIFDGNDRLIAYDSDNTIVSTLNLDRIVSIEKYGKNILVLCEDEVLLLDSKLQKQIMFHGHFEDALIANDQLMCFLDSSILLIQGKQIEVKREIDTIGTTWFTVEPVNFPYLPDKIEMIRSRRESNTLFIDRLLQVIQVDPSAYPPQSFTDLVELTNSILSSESDELKKFCIIYYLLLDRKNESAGLFCQKHFLPFNFVCLIEGYWHIDQEQLKEGINKLSNSSVNPDWISELFEIVLRKEELELVTKFWNWRQLDFDPTILLSVLLKVDPVNAFYFSREHSLFKEFLANVLALENLEKKFDFILSLPLNDAEEEYLTSHSNENETINDLSFVYFASRGRFPEAIRILKENKSASRKRISNDIRKILPNIQLQMISDTKEYIKELRPLSTRSKESATVLAKIVDNELFVKPPSPSPKSKRKVALGTVEYSDSVTGKATFKEKNVAQPTTPTKTPRPPKSIVAPKLSTPSRLRQVMNASHSNESSPENENKETRIRRYNLRSSARKNRAHAE